MAASPAAPSAIRTILLYCPYDRRVTRHARRGPQLRLVCLDCGRSLEEEPVVGRGAAPSKQRAVNGPKPEVIGPAAAGMPEADGEAPASAARRPRPRPAAPSHGSPSSATGRRGQRASIWRSLPMIVGGTVFTVLAAVNVVGNVVAPRTSEGVVLIEASRQGSGGTVYVANTEGQGVYLRATPSMDDRLYAVSEGAPLQVVGPDVSVEGVVWRPVEDPSGKRGWVPAHYTSPSAL